MIPVLSRESMIVSCKPESVVVTNVPRKLFPASTEFSKTFCEDLTEDVSVDVVAFCVAINLR